VPGTNAAATIGVCALLVCAAACAGEASRPPAQAGRATASAPEAAVSAPADAPAPAPPAQVDLRPELERLGLAPRPQGARGTCSIFTTCSAIEFALAQLCGRPERLSPEFLNWSAGQAAGAPSDGNVFHTALAGFERFGLCREEAMPYRAAFEPACAPSADALAQAERVRAESRAGLRVRWIVPWVPDRFGVDEAQLRDICATLARGVPVAAGSGHSRLLVGYVEDASLPGGGKFLTEDSALVRFDEVTFEFVRKQVADVFCVELQAPPAAGAAGR
jgi:hypothetical protein